MTNDVISLMKLIAAQLYALNADTTARALYGKGFFEASSQQQVAAYNALNNMILENFEHSSTLIQAAAARFPRANATPVGFAPSAPPEPPAEPPPAPKVE